MTGNPSYLKLFIFLCISQRLVSSFSVGQSQIRSKLAESLEKAPLSSERDEDWLVQDGDDDSEEETMRVSSVSSMEELGNKLDLILDSEAREKDLLQHFLRTSRETKDRDLSTIPTTTGPELAGKLTGGKVEEDEMSEAQTRVKVGLGSHGESSEETGDKNWMIVKKLAENSERMETMVVFLADLRNVLSEAVASQEKQVALRGEVVELREEIDYLRKEVQKLRTEQANHPSLKDPKLENKIHNDETTIQWLKESVKELRTGLEEVSSSVNVTGLVHLRQQWETEVSRVDGDLRSLRTDVEGLKGNQARDDEAILEIKGDIADLRTWHIKMGQKFLQEEQDQVIHEAAQTEEKQWASEKVSMDETRRKLNFHLTDSVSNEKGDHSRDERHRSRHQRKLKAEMTNIENIVRDVVRDQTILHKRLVKLESRMAKESKQKQRENSRGKRNHNSAYFNEEQTSSSNEIEASLASPSKINVKASRTEYGASNSFRINNLEKSLADYGNTVQHISDKVASLNELRESSTQLFTALEALETKYDERLTEMQTGLARMEAAVSATSITNDELRAQQSLQSRVMQSLKKELLATRGQVQTNHLRLATVQSQLLKWGLKTCSDLSAESIQNIKIASLETKLQDSYSLKSVQ